MIVAVFAFAAGIVADELLASRVITYLKGLENRIIVAIGKIKL